MSADHTNLPRAFELKNLYSFDSTKRVSMRQRETLEMVQRLRRGRTYHDDTASPCSGLYRHGRDAQDALAYGSDAGTLRRLTLGTEDSPTASSRGMKGIDLVGTDQRDAKTGPVSRSRFRVGNENGPRFDMG